MSIYEQDQSLDEEEREKWKNNIITELLSESCISDSHFTIGTGDDAIEPSDKVKEAILPFVVGLTVLRTLSRSKKRLSPEREPFSALFNKRVCLI